MAFNLRNRSLLTVQDYTQKEFKYLLDLARQRHNMDLAQTAEFCNQAVGNNDVYRLSKRQASVVIDRLGGKNGNGRR